MKRAALLPWLIIALCPSAQAQTTVAVLDFEASGVSEPTAVGVADVFRVELVNTGRFHVVERARIADVLAEQGLAMSGCTSNECVINLGALLGANRIITGKISLVGSTYICSVRMVDVELGTIELSELVEVKNETKLIDASKELAGRIAEAVPLITKVIAIEDDRLIIGAGSSHDVAVDQKVFIYRLGTEYYHPDTGLLMGYDTDEVGYGRVIEVIGPRIASVQFKGDLEPVIGDLVQVTTKIGGVITFREDLEGIKSGLPMTTYYGPGYQLLYPAGWETRYEDGVFTTGTYINEDYLLTPQINIYGGPPDDYDYQLHMEEYYADLQNEYESVQKIEVYENGYEFLFSSRNYKYQSFKFFFDGFLGSYSVLAYKEPDDPGISDILPALHGYDFWDECDGLDLLIEMILSFELKDINKIGYFGAGMQTLNDELRDEFDISRWTDGVIITEIGKGLPAQTAGLQIGDVITGLNGARVDNWEDFDNLRWYVLPGDEVVFDILRRDDDMQIKVIVGERPSEE